MKTLYEVLGVRPDASADQVTKAYRKRARRLHPDANPGDPEAEVRFKELTEAYEVLRDPERRAVYDRTGEVPKAKRPHAEENELLMVLIPCLGSTLEYVQKRWRALSRVDLVAELKRVIRSRREELERQRADAEACIRFTSEGLGRSFLKDGADEENLLDAALRRQVRQAEEVRDQIAAELDRLTRALGLLDRYGYRQDKCDASRAGAKLASLEAVKYWRLEPTRGEE